MSKLLRLLSLACAAGALLASSALGQASTWEKQAPLPTYKNMLSVSALSADEMWATAGSLFAQVGDLVHTTDGGVTWEVIPVNPTSTLNAVFFLDELHGWTAGNGFFHTTDGGQTWIQDNAWGSIYGLFFVDALHGWACGNGGVAYRTTNGGLSWTGVSTPAGHTLRSLWFADTLNGWSVAINGKVIKTTDGGVTWTVGLDLGAGSFVLPNTTKVQFLGNEGWILGGQTVQHTTDGGVTWAPQAVPTDTWAHGGAFADALHGVAVGEYGNIVRTQDGGQTWIEVEPQGTGQRLWDVSFAGGVAYLCGENGVVKRSSDLGATWQQISSGAGLTTRGLSVLDEQRAWAANEVGEIAYTTNGGAHWERVSVAGFDVYGDLYGIDFADAQNGWAVGQNQVFGTVDDGRISRSTDGGQTWTLQYSQPFVEFFGVLALDADTAIAYGRGNFASSAYLRTDDGGQTWVGGGPGGTINGFRDAFFLADGLTGWLVGNDIHKTTDGGLTWTKQYSGSAQLASVSFADAQHGWASGFANALLHTDDGGATWTPQSAGGPAGSAYMGVSAVSASEAYVCGWQHFVARTLDGGATWTKETLPAPTGHQPDPAAVEWNDIHFVAGDYGWVAGNEGILRKSVDASLAGSPTEISTLAGGAQLLHLQAGSAQAGALFVLLGSLSGTSPGIQDPGSGLVLPLNPDVYFNVLLKSSGAGVVSPFAANLDDGGFATAGVTLPPLAALGLTGATLHHAYFTIDLLLGGAAFVSDAVPLVLVP